MVRRPATSHTVGTDDRAVAPTVGFVLLVGLVVVCATTSALAGFYLIETLENDVEAEVTYSAAEGIDQQITTVARTGQHQSADLDGGAVRADGTVSVVWYDDEDEICEGTSVEDVPLGAIEYDAPDRTVVYQGGGIWEQRVNTPHTHSAPPIRDDDTGLEVRLVTLADSEPGSGERTIRPAREPADLEPADDRADACETLSIVVESDQYEAWHQYFETELPVAQNDEITVTADDEDQAVNATIENVSETRPDTRVRLDAVTLAE